MLIFIILGVNCQCIMLKKTHKSLKYKSPKFMQTLCQKKMPCFSKYFVLQLQVLKIFVAKIVVKNCQTIHLECSTTILK